jgi:dihydrofolate reductase
MIMLITAIAAADKNWGIGYKGKLPWSYNARDMKHFKDYTLGKGLVIGKNTYNEVGHLPDRTIYVVGKDPLQDLGSIILDCAQREHEELVIAGGAYTYEQFAPICSMLILTQFNAVYEVDKYLPESLRATAVDEMPNWQLLSATYYSSLEDDPAMTIASFRRVQWRKP